MRPRPNPALLFALSLFACGSPGDGGDDDGTGVPLECQPTATPAGWTYPAGPYGDDVGERLAEFTFDDCDGNPVRLGDLLSEAELVLISVGAGWCVPCIEETRTIEAEVFEPYCSRGLRVVQVLFQDDQSNPATKLFCDAWREQYGLEFPVLVDPLFTMQPYFGGPTSTQTPLNLLVDATGTIRWRSTGAVPADFHAQIESLLP